MKFPSSWDTSCGLCTLFLLPYCTYKFNRPKPICLSCDPEGKQVVKIFPVQAFGPFLPFADNEFLASVSDSVIVTDLNL